MAHLLQHLTARWRAGGSQLATIDAVKAAPPPSPLAPVDLTDPAQVTAVMDLAARIGHILLAAGTSNRDTLAHIHAVTSTYGLHYAHVDITLNTITLFTTIGTETKTPVSVFRVVSHMRTDFSKLSEVDRLIRSIQAGATPPEVAIKILDDLTAARPTYGPKVAVLGWGGLGASACVLLGGNALGAVLSFVLSALIIAGARWLGRQSLPVFFQNVFGGFMSTLPVAVAYSLARQVGMDLRPSQVIAACLIVLLAGLTMVQSLQDGITGAPVTASARFFETFLFTGAIVAGVGVGMQASELLGITLPTMETGAQAGAGIGYVDSAVLVGAGVAASASFALACYAEFSAIVVSALTAATGASIYYLLLMPAGVDPVISTAIAATVIGVAGGLLARRFLIPPLITAIAGITPMLPGLWIYRGMYAALNDQMLVGFTNVALALSICCALAAGVVLGEWTARKIRRPKVFNPYKAFRRPRRYTFPEQSTGDSGLKVVYSDTPITGSFPAQGLHEDQK
ncbi:MULTISPECIES: threonine/serine exporter ThrE [Corynebacterium]